MPMNKSSFHQSIHGLFLPSRYVLSYTAVPCLITALMIPPSGLPFRHIDHREQIPSQIIHLVAHRWAVPMAYSFMKLVYGAMNSANTLRTTDCKYSYGNLLVFASIHEPPRDASAGRFSPHICARYLRSQPRFPEVLSPSACCNLI